jgi:hypothetical protein
MENERPYWLGETIAIRVLQQAAVDQFAIPGDSNFPLGGLVRAPSSANEAGARA